MFICQISKSLAYSGWGGGQNSPPSSFSPATSISVEISPKKFLTLSLNPFATPL